jgi:hypothetical protein
MAGPVARTDTQRRVGRVGGHGGHRQPSAEASHLALNPVFQLKAVLVAAGLTNVAIYEFWAKPAVEHVASNASMPTRAKVTGALSLVIWIAVAACGRSIAYF